MEIELASPAFQEGGAIPKQYTGDGQDVSPPLSWPDAPEGTQSFALLCEDPDAPRKTWIHWVLFNVPAAARELSEGRAREADLRDDARQGGNELAKVGSGARP